MTTRTWARVTGVAAAATLAVALVPGSAQAASRTVTDRYGDAPRAADLTRVKVSNGEERVSGTLTFAHPRKPKKLAMTNLIIKVKGSGSWRYVVAIVRDDHGTVTNRELAWMKGDDPSTYTPLVCDGVKEKVLTARKVKISVPVSCLTKTTKRKVKVKATILARVGPGHDWWDEVTRFSPYVKRG